MSSSKPPPQAPDPAPVTVNGAQMAQDKLAQMAAEKKRYDWSKTILRAGATPGTQATAATGALPAGTRSTFGIP